MENYSMKKNSQDLRNDYGGTGSSPKHGPDTDTHCHTENDNKSKEDDALANITKAKRKLIIASVICFVFMIAEIVGGVLANSLAIATDAAHLLADLASFLIGLFAIWLATRPATKNMSFGWFRAEVVGALVSVLSLWVVTGILCYMAVQRVMDLDSFNIDPMIMLISACLGLFVNIVMAAQLHDFSSHTHSHGSHSHGPHSSHGHSHEPASTKKISPESPSSRLVDSDHNSSSSDAEKGSVDKHADKHANNSININVRAALIHVIGDIVQSLGVVLASLIVFFKPEWKIADPICTFIFSILVLFTTIHIMKDIMHVLMEGTPRFLNFLKVRNGLREIESVRKIHNLRVWSLTMTKTAVSVHIAIDKSSCPEGHHQVLKEASALLHEQFGVHECTIQIEDYVDEMDDCVKCNEHNDHDEQKLLTK